QPRRLDGVARHDDMSRALKAPATLPMVVHARDPSIVAELDAAHHRQVTDFGASGECARDEGDELALLGIGRAAKAAEAAIDTRRGAPMSMGAGRGDRGERCGCP